MAKMDVGSLLKELNKHLEIVVSQPDKWVDFLKSAAWNYKYGFQNQLLIHSQRPDATACAEFDVWNSRLHRFVMRGSKGIAILNETGDRVSYVFDVSNTRSLNGEELKLWQIEEDSYDDVLNVLNAEHEFNCETIEDALVRQVDFFVENAGTLYLPDGDVREDKAFVDAFNECVKYSSCVVALLRCGFDVAARAYADLYFKNINEVFDTNEKIIALGTAVSSISKLVLKEIEHDVRVINKRKLMADKENEIVEANDNGNDIQTSRGISDSGNFSGAEDSVDGEDRENGNVEIEISSIQQADALHNSFDAGRVGEASDGHRGDGEFEEGTTRSESFGRESSAVEERESDGLGAAHELNSVDGGRGSEEGTDFPLDDVLFPSVEEQLDIIENATSNSLDNFEISQQDIDDVLAYGSNVGDGKFRIYEFFNEKHTAKEKVEFLKNEYGLGGHTTFFADGRRGYTGFDGPGITISKYQSITDPDVVLNWNKVQKRIGGLIKAGRYLNEKEMAEYPEYKADMELRVARAEIGNKYIALVREYNDFLRNNGQSDSLLNQYVLVDCGACFIDGRVKTSHSSMDGDFILPLMRDSLNTIIVSDAPFKERAEDVLTSLEEDSLKKIGFIKEENLTEVENDYVSVPAYKVGDIVFNGASKYTIVEVGETSVYLSDVEFELNSLDLTKEDFDKVILENPSNSHLVKKIAQEDYNSLINHAISVIDEVEKELLPEEEPSLEVVGLVRVGDFFEVRGEFAERVAEELDLVLTSKLVDGERVPMIGFPVVHLDAYNEKLAGANMVLVEAPLEELSEDSVMSENTADNTDTVKRNSLVARNYDALNRLAPGIMNGDYEYLRFERAGFEPLTVEWVGNNFISVMHSFIQNGDVMRDPDIVLSVDNKNKTVTAASFEMSATGSYEEYMDFDSKEVVDSTGQKETDSFFRDWMKNVERQDYTLVRGITRDGDEVRFDANGDEISEEIPEGLEEKYQVRLYRSYDAPDVVKAYVSTVNASLEKGHIVEDEREVYESFEAAENAVENFNTVFGFDEEFRNELLSRIPAPVLHKYYSTQRPVGPGTYPKHPDYPVVNIVNFDERIFVEEINRGAWGYIEFERPLPLKQAEDYELVMAPYVEEEKEVIIPVVSEMAEEKHSDDINKGVERGIGEFTGEYVFGEDVELHEGDIVEYTYQSLTGNSTHRGVIVWNESHNAYVINFEDLALRFLSQETHNIKKVGSIYKNAELIEENEGLEEDGVIPEITVLCEWSEHEGFEDGKEYSFAEFDSLMKKLDKEVYDIKQEYRARNDYYPYFKTRFVIKFPDGYEYSGRQDIGDGDGSLLDHVRSKAEYNLKKIRENGYDGLYKDDEREGAIKHFEKFLNSYVPLLEEEVQGVEFAYDRDTYQIGYGGLGNGTTVWNRADIDSETNDYRIIAHISDDGTVKFYDNDLPGGVKNEIKHRAFGFAEEYLKDILAQTIDSFRFWYLEKMVAVHPQHIPGKSFSMDDCSACYNALHNDRFVRNVDVPLILQLESLARQELSLASVETKKVVAQKIHDGEISPEDLSKTLGQLDATQIRGADDVYDELAKEYVDEQAGSPVKVGNFKITDNNLGVGGPKEKYRNNVAAIKLLNQLESEGRQATADEQVVLSKYVGWGGLDAAFDVNNGSWANEYKELQELLTTDEYRSAKASTLSSFYTQPVIINAIYDGLRNLGFKRGNVLEPACGVGNFFGMLPDDFSDSSFYGVELDSVSGRIAKQLYPDAKIAVKGYEDTKFKNDFFDVAIGNVPFGQFKVNDKEYNKLNYLIHDYFFAKTLDKVRPGGVIAFITSKGTLDKQSPEVRKYIAQRAELLGAIRLPNNAFLANAGTKATSDIIFLQKRDKAIEIEPDWVHLGFTEDGIPINSYFVERPEMVLGHMEMDRMQYGREDSTCVPIPGAVLSEQLEVAIKNIKGDLSSKTVDFDEALDKNTGDLTDLVVSVPADPNVRNFSYTLVDGDIYYRLDDEMIKQEFNPTREQRVRGLIEIRDSLRRLIDLQRYDYSDYEIEKEQAKLNKLYDEYTEKYGLINCRGNSMAFQDDNSYYLLCSLENVDEKGELVSKADMFTKKTIKRHVPVVSVGTASEALSVSISEKARVDLAYMSDLTDMSREKLVSELQGVIFCVPYEYDAQGYPLYVTSDEYLSGNVREKLKTAQMAAKTDPRFEVNVMALEKVIPKDLEAHEIDLRLGSVWVPEDVVNEFMWELLDTPNGYLRNTPDVQAHYSELNGSWTIKNKNWYDHMVKARSTYGTGRMHAYDIILHTLNLKTVEIFDYIEDDDGKKKRVLNKEETVIAQQKQESIKEAFVDWVWRDPARRQRLVRLYNDKFNNIKLREYDGQHLVFEGMNPEITLMEHQKNAVAHAIYGGNTLLAHEVGAGKTYEMAAVAMESKRLGLCSKSMIVVPNHLLQQWASEFYQLYPSANLLVASKKDFEPANRKKFCSRIATGDYDAVIIGHSQFEKIPLSVDLQSRFIQEEIDEIEEGIRELEAEGGDRPSVKSLEKTRKSLELRLEKLNDINQDDVITFEELGVDKLFIDEAHYFKNLFLYTKMHNVAGISQTEAKKSSDLYMKTRYLNDLTGARGVVFATGTPISNSMAETYTLQRYLQYNTLKANGLIHFDAWASTFGEVVTAVELAPEGTGYRAKTRFAKFHNIPELMTLFKLVADIKTGDDLDLPKPDAEFHIIQAQPSKLQEEIVESLGERAKAVRDGGVNPSVDNMLKITNDGRLLGLDQRCYDESLPDNENSKLNQAVENIFDIWEKHADEKLAQLVFSDISTPTGKGFSVYNDIKQKLIAKGIPEDEIAFIHDANTDVQKEKLFAKVRAGEVRVLMGSTPKMGAGTNVQDKLIALHDLDCPWRPSDLEQRLGRILRQGNQQDEVQIYRYVTQGTFDAYLWQLVENKQRFISQIMTSKSPVRSADDIDDAVLSYAEIKSLCVKDPRIKEKMELDVAVAKLKLVKSNFLSQKYRLEDDISVRYPSAIKRNEQYIVGYKADIEHVKEFTVPDAETGFSPMVIKGVFYSNKKEAGNALLEAVKSCAEVSKTEIGEYRGFKLLVQYDPFTKHRQLYLRGALTHWVDIGESDTGNIVRIDNVISGLPKHLQECEQNLSDAKAELEVAKVEVTKVFPQEEELKSMITRLDELDALLRMDEKGGEMQSQDKAEDSSKGLDTVLANAYSRAGDISDSTYGDKDKDFI